MTTQLFGLQIWNRSRSELLAYLDEQHSHPVIIFTPNPEQIVLAHQHSSFQKALQQATVLIPDGVGLLLAAKVLAKPVAERITGVSLVEDILRTHANKEIMVIGGRGYPSEFTYNSAHVITHPGYASVQQPTAEEEKKLTLFIEKNKPQILFVAFGAPDQEKWVISHVPLLKKIGTEIVMVVGGSFDELLGKVQRTPAWIDAMGLKWFHRLVTQPWRWKRQLRLLKFIQLTFSAIGKQ